METKASNTLTQFNSFVNKYAGDRIDYDKTYGYQCVDLIRVYAEYAGYPEITNKGNAIDLWKKGLGKGYTKELNSLSNKPPIGAIVFWNQGKYGHVAIAGRGNMLYVDVLEQNGGKGKGNGLGDDAIRVRKDFYRNCLGWFIAK